MQSNPQELLQEDIIRIQAQLTYDDYDDEENVTFRADLEPDASLMSNDKLTQKMLRHFSRNKIIPWHLCSCPLSKATLQDPVIAADGNTYERGSLKRYLKKNRNHLPNGTYQNPEILMANEKIVWLLKMFATIQEEGRYKPEIEKDKEFVYVEDDSLVSFITTLVSYYKEREQEQKEHSWRAQSKSMAERKNIAVLKTLFKLITSQMQEEGIILEADIEQEALMWIQELTSYQGDARMLSPLFTKEERWAMETGRLQKEILPYMGIFDKVIFPPMDYCIEEMRMYHSAQDSRHNASLFPTKKSCLKLAASGKILQRLQYYQEGRAQKDWPLLNEGEMWAVSEGVLGKIIEKYSDLQGIMVQAENDDVTNQVDCCMI